MKLDHLRDIYINHLKETKYSNDGYLSEKLEAKLIKNDEEKLSFHPSQLESGPFESHLVYNSQTDVGKAVKQAYLLGKADKTRDVAITLRADVQKAHTRTLIQSHGLHLLGT